MTGEQDEGLGGLVRSRWLRTEPPETVAEDEPRAVEPEFELERDPEPGPDAAAHGDPEPEPDPAVDPDPDSEFEPQPEPGPEAGSVEVGDDPGLPDHTQDGTILPATVEGTVSATLPADDAADEAYDFEIVEAADPSAVREHAVDLRMARLHLRTGAVQLARAELESLATLRALDRDAFLDLAETRWRAGDLAGAGDAVVEYLEGGGTEPLAYVIAAEASAAMGRLGDARRLARRAMDRLTVPLERVFAGQPRSEVWPGPTDAEIQPVSTLFASPPPDAARGGRIGVSGAADEQLTRVRPLEPLLSSGVLDPWDSAAGPAALAPDPRYEPLPLGLDLDSVQSRPVEGSPAPAVGSGADLDAARAAVETGDLERAGLVLALVLRATPALAPAVLDVAGDRPSPMLDLVRGDALRLVGREGAAREAFAAAARAVLGTPSVEDAAPASGPATPEPTAELVEADLLALWSEPVPEPEPEPAPGAEFEPAPGTEPEPIADLERSAARPPAPEPDAQLFAEPAQEPEPEPEPAVEPVPEPEPAPTPATALEPHGAAPPEPDATGTPSFDDTVGGWPTSTRRYRPPPPVRRPPPPPRSGFGRHHDPRSDH